MWNQSDRQSSAAPKSSAPLPPASSAPALAPIKQQDSTIRKRESTVACIGKSVIVKGEVTSAEDLVIEGRVEGKIHLQGHSLVVGQGGDIRAEIVAKAVTVHGTVTGNVTAVERVEVRETGSIVGDIVTPGLAVSEGAVLSGRVQMPRTAVNREQLPVAV
jgi:cytoskeletal protein CcmA (bactofilin family)